MREIGVEVLIDGVRYLPAAAIPELTDQQLKKALNTLVQAFYLDDWSRPQAVCWEAIHALAPELASLVSDDPKAAFELISRS